MRDDQQATIHDAEEDEAILAIILTVVDKVDRKRVIKGFAGVFERFLARKAGDRWSASVIEAHLSQLRAGFPSF